MSAPQKEHLTVPEVAEMVGVHEQTIRRWLREEQLEGTLITRQTGYRIRRDEVDRLLREGLRPGKDLAAA
jgi:excisionase family DNA binding protein